MRTRQMVAKRGSSKPMLLRRESRLRAVAEVVGASERTVWRWLEQAKATGRVEAPVRRGYAVSDGVWELLGEAGGMFRS
ncbi:hypothetical protein M2271_007706 [Streptomyces sp. LBL]|uniref:helix-turn-helix domain-containing protein n=1 Tax=Streptomyces sp. LBL TaxID=2940562 RepID=UPI002477110E|nr:hypothetical protein [Streptomyces sp. LBL]MDH6629857.1 hypothetical protein [Streptomyces sp. LBL]